MTIRRKKSSRLTRNSIAPAGTRRHRTARFGKAWILVADVLLGSNSALAMRVCDVRPCPANQHQTGRVPAAAMCHEQPHAAQQKAALITPFEMLESNSLSKAETFRRT